MRATMAIGMAVVAILSTPVAHADETPAPASPAPAPPTSQPPPVVAAPPHRLTAPTASTTTTRKRRSTANLWRPRPRTQTPRSRSGTGSGRHVDRQDVSPPARCSIAKTFKHHSRPPLTMCCIGLTGGGRATTGPVEGAALAAVIRSTTKRKSTRSRSSSNPTAPTAARIRRSSRPMNAAIRGAYTWSRSLHGGQVPCRQASSRTHQRSSRRPARRAPGRGPRPRRGHRGHTPPRGSRHVQSHPYRLRRAGVLVLFTAQERISIAHLSWYALPP
jgi:hypothetical protein